MTIVGRITKDAVVDVLKDDRNVVHFSIAVNDYYKPKGAAEGVKVTMYVNCSYWKGTKIAERLKKGSLVEISGRIYVSPYVSKEGEAKASLNCHVNQIKIHSTSKEVEVIGRPIPAASTNAEAKDDTPF